MNSPTQNPFLSYREAAVVGASPVRMVILLYEQAMEDLRRARAALRSGDIQKRTQQINHAILVLGYLQTSLDREQGGKVAEDLQRFYSQVRASLMQAQFRQSESLIEQQIRDLFEVREAWCEVERSAKPAAPSAGSYDRIDGSSSSEWKA
jgi:flagellar protein FliS